MKIDLVPLFLTLAVEVNLDLDTRMYCVRRIKSEGIHFLTVTLPKLGKTLLRSLELGYFDQKSITDFAWKGAALVYFRVKLKNIFDLKTGLLLDHPCALSIFEMRQLCEYFYKLALPYSDDKIEAATEKFISTERELASPYDKNVADQARKDLETYMPYIARTCVSDVFKHSVPRPGSGTFSGKNSFGEKWYMRKEYDNSYPSGFHAYSGYFRYLASQSNPVENVSDPNYSEVLFVPKDSRGPRTIVREPFSRLKAQMAFFDWITDKLESNTNVRFTNQQANRSLAEKSSVNKDYATLDLKEASDRVRFDIALHVFRNSPSVMYFLKHARTSHAKLPNGDIITLRKVAGMGSGLTFPLMSLLIYLVSVRSVADFYHTSFRHASQHVHVYGDDLIVPVHCYERVCDNLSKIGLAVNKDKSFRLGNFRESCGGDYFNGQDVTPLKLRLATCDLHADGSSLYVKGDFTILQIDRHCRELVQAGFLRTADYFYSKLSKATKSRGYNLPYVSGESPYIGRYTLDKEITRSKCKENSSGLYKKALALVVKPVTDFLEDWMCGEHFLGKSLKRSLPAHGKWTDHIFPVGSSVDGVSVPRSVRTVLTNKSSLSFV